MHPACSPELSSPSFPFISTAQRSILAACVLVLVVGCSHTDTSSSVVADPKISGTIIVDYVPYESDEYVSLELSPAEGRLTKSVRPRALNPTHSALRSVSAKVINCLDVPSLFSTDKQYTATCIEQGDDRMIFVARSDTHKVLWRRRFTSNPALTQFGWSPRGATLAILTIRFELHGSLSNLVLGSFGHARQDKTAGIEFVSTSDFSSREYDLVKEEREPQFRIFDWLYPD
jgi:hypothetical protein